MQAHQLPSIKKRVQRIGRSGKRGSYSGRGVKGQKSRAGRRIRPAERDLILRIPKKRGYANLPKTAKNEILNLNDLSRRLKSFALNQTSLEVDLGLLKAAGLLAKGYKGQVKLLGDGEILFPIVLKNIKASARAKAKIEKAGGKARG